MTTKYKEIESSYPVEQQEEENSTSETPEEHQSTTQDDAQNNNTKKDKPVCVVKPFKVDNKPKEKENETPQQQTENTSATDWLLDNAWKIAAGVAVTAAVVVGASSLLGRKKDDKNDDND